MSSDHSKPGKDWEMGRFLQVFTACFVLLFTLAVVSQLSGINVWDDALMYARYAGNALEYHVISWNRGAGPAYGLTSNLYLLAVVVPLRFFIASPVLLVVASSVVCGFVFIGLLVLMLYRFAVFDVRVRDASIVFALLAAAPSVGSLAVHVVGGMDTAFALAFITAYIILCSFHEQSKTAGSALLAGAFGGLAFSARPDLMLYTLAVPACMLVFPGGASRRNGALMLCATVAVLVLQLFLNASYFGTPLPLSFHVKGQRYYGSFIYGVYGLVPAAQLLRYLGRCWPLFLVVALDVLAGFNAWRRRASGVEAGLAAGTCFFILYYLFFVLQVMPYSQRFYYPTFPALVFLAARSFSRVAGRVIRRCRDFASCFPKPVRVFGMLFVLGLLVPFGFQYPGMIYYGIMDGRFLNFGLHDVYERNYRGYLFRLEEFSSLPDGVVVASTEVGIASAFNPGKTIVDLSGLNNPYFALNGFSAEYLFGRDRPDLIFMPHPDYREMNEQITGSQYFVKNYDYYPGGRLGTFYGIAIHKNSNYYAEMSKIVGNRAKKS